jgi:hypothetical protein
MFYKKIQKNTDNTTGFQKVLNFEGSKTLSGNKLLFTYANLDDTTLPYGNLFKTFKLPITNSESVIYNNTFNNTALEYFSNARKIIIVEIPKGEYGELLDGKTFKLKIPVVINSALTSTTLYGSYFNFNVNLNKDLSDRNTFSSQFGFIPNKDNDFNSNVTYLFSNEIKKPVGDIIENVILTSQTLTVTQRFQNNQKYVFTSFTVSAGDILYVKITDNNEEIRQGPSLGNELENRVTVRLENTNTNVSFNKFYTVPNSIITPESLTISKIVSSDQNVTVSVSRFNATTLNWDQYTSSNKFPPNSSSISGKRYASFSGKQITYENTTQIIPLYDKPVGILYQDKGIAIITDETLVNGFVYSSATSSGYNNIASGNSYTGNTNFVKIYFSSSASAETNYNSVTTEYIQNVTCIAMPNEFYTTNNSTFENSYDENTYEKPVFITTIGLYNKFGELVAIGKTSEPIKKTVDNIIPFNVKLKL